MKLSLHARTRASAATLVLSLSGLAGIVVACSAESSSPSGDTSPTNPGPSGGSSGTPTPTTTTTTPPPPHCPFDATCDRAFCPCDNGTTEATPGVCKKNGQCDTMGACAEACGAPVKYAETYKACTSDLGCFTSQPVVDCACKQGFGHTAYKKCIGGYCTGAAELICPESCKNEGGWLGCATAGQCAPVICNCKDGHLPVPKSVCSAGKCSQPSEQCPAACSAHGGWNGGSTATDAGTDAGPKKPGDPCTKSTECTAFDCGCNNGSKFNNNKVCSSGTCGTKAATCGFVCMNSGGWDGL